MRTCQRPPAEARVELEVQRGHRLDHSRPLHVAQLPPVQMTVLLHALRPSEVDVARRLHHPLAVHHALSGLLEPALRQVILKHGGRCLLDLQEERVALVAALQEDDESPRADAADSDDLAGDVDDLEALQEVASVALQGGAVRTELPVDHGSQLVSRHPGQGGNLPERDDDRWLADDPIRPSTTSASFDSACRLSRVRAFAAAFWALRSPSFTSFLLGFRVDPPRVARKCLDRGHQVRFREVRIPDIHRAHIGEPGHGLSVATNRCERGRLDVRLREPVVPAPRS